MDGDISYIPVAVWPPEGDSQEVLSPKPGDKKAGGGSVVFDEASIRRGSGGGAGLPSRPSTWTPSTWATEIRPWSSRATPRT